MNRRDKLKESFERNRALDKRTKKRSFDFRRVNGYWAAIAAAVAVVGSFLLIPEKVFSFGANLQRLNQAYTNVWLEPTRWDGSYSASPEEYVDIEDMSLSSDFAGILFLYYDANFSELDGELISDGFCEGGLPYRNLLVRGSLHPLLKNSIELEFFDIIGGDKVVFGQASGRLDYPVIELSDWIFGEGIRLAKDSHINRDDIASLCDEFFKEVE